ncbi:MAG: tetratricopeptide repeat protein [Candidatus Hydrogenedentes bacterium]|nr:tetratricopeptide repeat protein [Candidatus Hydrogenedentota bacterium]
MKNKLGITIRIGMELACAVIVGVLVWQAGSARLEGWTGPAASLSNDLFVPAIMLNGGRGFTNVEPSELPELRAFLDFRAQAFDPELIRDSLEIRPLHPFQEYHRYLIYSVAGVWRIFGVNWDAVKVLILFYFFLAAIAVYGICRLAMNPVFSLAAATAFIFAPAVLWTLPILRDFVKAPFILALILVLGTAIKYRLTTRRYLALAAVAGLLLGVGIGFRRDMVVFLPAAIFFICVCRLQPGSLSFWRRPAAAAMIAILFVASGWPVHKALFRDGYVAAHDTIMGFASYSDHELGVIHPASYEKHYLLNDLYCTMKAHDCARRGVTFAEDVYRKRCNEPEFDLEMKQAYVMAVIRTFPADMIARAYAAVVRMATAITASPWPPVHQVESWGIGLMAAGMLLVAFREPLQAWLMLVMVLYFCGCLSLQFAFRHAFHMSFLPYFFAGLVASQLMGLVMGGIGIWRCRKSRTKSGIAGNCLKGVLKGMGFALAAGLMLYAPLTAARWWQSGTVGDLRRQYAEAPLRSLPYRTTTWNDRILFIPQEGRACHLCQTDGLIVAIETRCMAAAFKQVDRPLDIRIVYEWEGLSWDFSSRANYRFTTPVSPTDFKYYFPVHETSTCTDWNHFVGLSLPKEQAVFFDGYYQTVDLDGFGLLVNMAVPDRSEQFLDFQALVLPQSGGIWSPYTLYEGFNPFLEEMKIRGEEDPLRAEALAREALLRQPGSIQFTFLLAEALERKGEPEKARQECLALIDLYPDSFVFFARLNQFFLKYGGISRCREEWKSILEQYPFLDCARFYLEEAERKSTDENTDINPGAIE